MRFDPATFEVEQRREWARAAERSAVLAARCLAALEKNPGAAALLLEGTRLFNAALQDVEAALAMEVGRA